MKKAVLNKKLPRHFLPLICFIVPSNLLKALFVDKDKCIIPLDLNTST